MCEVVMFLYCVLMLFVMIFDSLVFVVVDLLVWKVIVGGLLLFDGFVWVVFVCGIEVYMGYGMLEICLLMMIV